MSIPDEDILHRERVAHFCLHLGELVTSKADELHMSCLYPRRPWFVRVLGSVSLPMGLLGPATM